MIMRPLRPGGAGLALALSSALAIGAGAALAQNAPSTEGGKAAYGLGYLVGQDIAGRLEGLEFSEEERALVAAAMADALEGVEPKTDVEEGLQILQKRQEAALQAALEKLKAANQEVLDQEAAKEGATRTESGLIHTTLTEGDGAAPTAESTVKVHYRGSLPEGTEFDSSYTRGEPTSFNLGRVIPCFREGIQTMKTGGKARLVCPPEIAYGARGAGEAVPPHAVLIFEVELLGIE